MPFLHKYPGRLYILFLYRHNSILNMLQLQVKTVLVRSMLVTLVIDKFEMRYSQRQA